jgi:hypothetical protein
MKTLTEIAIESGFHPHENQFCVYYADEDTLQAFVDAVNAQNSESVVSSGGIDLSFGGISSSCGGIAELEKDAERLRLLMTMSGEMYQESIKFQFVGRLREFIDANKAAIDEAMKGSE